MKFYLDKELLPEFKAYLISHGETILDCKADYEALRWDDAPSHMPILYRSSYNKKQYTINRYAIPFYRRFLKFRRKNKRFINNRRKTMKFNKEDTQDYLIEDGAECDFSIKTCEETTSKAGNEMLKLTIRVRDKQGRVDNIWDYITKKQYFKLKDLMPAIGKAAMLEPNEPEITWRDLQGCKGKCIVKVEPAKDGYAERLAIKTYIASKEQKTSEEELNDDIPF